MCYSARFIYYWLVWFSVHAETKPNNLYLYLYLLLVKLYKCMGLCTITAMSPLHYEAHFPDSAFHHRQCKTHDVMKDVPEWLEIHVLKI